MRLMRKAALVYANEGFRGLRQRLAQRILRQKPRESPRPDGEPVRRAYQEHANAFHARAQELGVAEEIAGYYWYHTIDLGNGLVTPGDYDYRDCLDSFPFPVDMTGMRVLDVGSATGFFAFEFERRGAEVVSVELPSLEAWDILTSERAQVLSGFSAESGGDGLREAYQRHLYGPFQFCQRMLGSKMRRCYSTVYDLTPVKLGRSQFDLIYVGDVLLHLFAPLKALDMLASLCKGSLVITIEAGPSGGRPNMEFIGYREVLEDRRSWWNLSRTCIEHMLKRIGFASVEAAGRYQGWMRRVGYPFDREIICARR